VALKTRDNELFLCLSSAYLPDLISFTVYFHGRWLKVERAGENGASVKGGKVGLVKEKKTDVFLCQEKLKLQKC
jgi:hypothetical protein